MTHMGKELEQQSKRPANTGIKDLVIGLPFLCNPNLITDFLLARLRQTYLSLLSSSNERDEVLSYLEQIPDGLERDVASFINKATEIMGKHGKRRRIGEKIHNKPHLKMVHAIRTAKNVFTR